jgi:biotin synthase
LDEQTILDGARAAAASGSGCYGIVTSGSGIRSGEELDRICSVIRQIRAEGLIAPGASLGTLDEYSVQALKEAGLVTYHHNLETSRSFFPQICSTHAYDDDIATVRLAKQAGLRVCSGGLFGLGETMEQRVELALTLRELDVDSVPINFLDPVEGTPLAGSNNLTPLECLQSIALFRLILPKAHITICGGREKNLRDLHSWLFMAGASGIMTGNYLTKEGRQPGDDRQMIADLGLTLAEGLVR